VYSIGSFGVDGLVTYFMSQEFGASEALIGRYGALRGLGAVLGAVGGGLLLDKVSRKLGARAAVLAITVGAALFGLASGNTMVVMLGLVWAACGPFTRRSSLLWPWTLPMGALRPRCLPS